MPFRSWRPKPQPAAAVTVRRMAKSRPVTHVSGEAQSRVLPPPCPRLANHRSQSGRTDKEAEEEGAVPAAEEERALPQTRGVRAIRGGPQIPAGEDSNLGPRGPRAQVAVASVADAASQGGPSSIATLGGPPLLCPARVFLKTPRATDIRRRSVRATAAGVSWEPVAVAPCADPRFVGALRRDTLRSEAWPLRIPVARHAAAGELA